MTTVNQVALAFVAGKAARCHNAHTDGRQYVLHKSVIAQRQSDGSITGDWCGYRTVTTQNHLGAIRDALGAVIPLPRRGGPERFVLRGPDTARWLNVGLPFHPPEVKA